MDVLIHGSGKWPEMASYEVWEADFWSNRHYKTSPVDLEGSRGQLWPWRAEKSTILARCGPLTGRSGRACPPCIKNPGVRQVCGARHAPKRPLLLRLVRAR